MPLPEHLLPKPKPIEVALPADMAQVPIQPEVPQSLSSLVTCPATLLLSPTGNGKTDSLLTFIEAGVELFVASTESNGVETLLRSCRRRGLDINKLHWRQCQPTNMNMQSMIDSADQLNKKSVSDMQKIDNPGILQKSKFRTYINLLETVANFRCQRTGQAYGDVTQWDDSRAFVIDSLSGLNLMMTQLQIGNRGTLTLPDYNVCQITLENLIVTLCACKCFFVLTGHIEREKDEITGKVKVMASTIGQKLAPKLPIHFSEVVRATRTGTEFTWSTVDDEGEWKARALPWSNKIRPTFTQLVEAYRADKKFALSQEALTQQTD